MNERIKEICKPYHLYLFGLLLLAASQPLSRFMVSVSQFWLVGAWILHGNFAEKWLQFKKNKIVWLLPSLWLIHVVWLIGTDDWAMAFKDIKIKLPLLLLPIIVGTIPRLTVLHVKLIVYTLAVSCLIASVYDLVIYHVRNIEDPRNMSVFISHIRFSLYINVVILFILYEIYENHKSLHHIFKIVAFSMLIWFVVFLFLLQSFTGIIILIICLVIFFLKITLSISQKWIKLGTIAVVFILLSQPIIYLNRAVEKFYTIKDDLTKINSITPNGNKYSNDYKQNTIENGHYTGLYVCDVELIESWNKRSKIQLSGLDAKGKYIYYTTIRYLTSKGLRKDLDGVYSLSQKDIENIESGIPNIIFEDRSKFDVKIYELIWQFDVYSKGGYASGHSVTQRFEFLKVGWYVFRHHFWMGIGTGDTFSEFSKAYIETKSNIDKEFRYHSHNQLFTFLITFGCVGSLWIFSVLVYYFYYGIKNKLFMFSIFYTIAFLSFLNEDTFETQAGSTFFAFFYCVFLFTTNNQDLADSDKPKSVIP